MPAWISRIDFYTALAAGANVALAALGAIVSVYDKWAKKHRAPILAGFVALGCLGAIAAIVAAAKSAQDLQDANTRVNKAVDETRKEVLATMTGGDSFCYAEIDPLVQTKPGKVNLLIIHHGKYPLHEVMLVLIDFQKAMNITLGPIARGLAPPDQQEVIRQTSRRIPLQPLLPNHYSQISFDYEPLPTKSHEYSLSFDGPNGHWDQVLRFQIVNGKVAQAFRVFKEIPGSEGLSSQKLKVLEHVDHGFPSPVKWD